MTQASPPTVETCTRLLRAMPAMAAFKKAIRETAPPDTLSWLGSLMVLDRFDDGRRPSQLAETLHLDLSVVSRSLSQLEQLGYVDRVRDPADGRASIFTVTDTGHERATELRDGFAEHVRELLDDWTDEDVGRFADFMVRFHASLEHKDAAR